jgi:TrmH family RNA methyltransferase
MSMLITSRKNQALAAYRELNRDRKQREAGRKFNIEGVRLCEEALTAGLTITAAFMTETAERRYPELCERLAHITITDEIGGYIADTKTPQGVFATAEMPEREFVPDGDGLILLDGLQDAGNVGTVIRTAEALGIGGAVLSPDCADIWSPKVVRGAMGSLFRLPVTVTPLPEFIKRIRADGYRVYAAVLNEKARSIDDTELSGKCAVVIGNEGNGVSPEVINSADADIYIPIRKAESLNAAIAAAIFCNEMRRK